MKRAKSISVASNGHRVDMPYHVFNYQGDTFVAHVGLGHPLKISHEARAYLDLRASGECMQPVSEVLRDEIATLESVGFFVSCETPIPTDEEFDRLLRQRYEAPWTKLELALSEVCNLACRYCYCGTCRDEVPNQGRMSESVARAAINWLFAVSGRSKDVGITFFGGEPLMNKEVLLFAVSYSQRLAKIHGKKVFYSMTTNGTLIDDDVISIIKRYNFGLMVSLDGSKELHDKQCPTRTGAGSFDLAVAGIKRLMARRKRVTVRCTMAHPAPDMMNLIRFFEDFGFSRIVLGRVFNPVYPSPCDLTPEDSAELERQMNEIVIPWMLDELKAGRTPKYFPFSGVLEEKLEAEPISPFRCGACRGTMTVGADGTLYPCHRFVGMKKWIIGTIWDGPDVERCKSFWREYHAMSRKHCFSCWAYQFCKGPCPWEVARADGSFIINERNCDEAKHWIMQGAWFESLYAKTMKGMKT